MGGGRSKVQQAFAQQQGNNRHLNFFELSFFYLFFLINRRSPSHNYIRRLWCSTTTSLARTRADSRTGSFPIEHSKVIHREKK